MRDPDRINPVLEKIRQVWLQDPDLRLGQLLINVIQPKEPSPEVFYIEERDLMRRLDQFFQRKVGK